MVTRTVDLDAPLEMRPKVVWRVVNPAVGVLFAVAGMASGGPRAWIGGLTFAVLGAAAFRGYIRVQDGVLYRRGTFRWHPPFALDDLTDVAIQRVWYSTIYPHLELRIFDSDRNVETVSLTWWSNWESLAAIVALTASEPTIEQPDHREWRLDLDHRTRRWLDPYLRATR